MNGKRAVRPESLDNQERDMGLEDRTPARFPAAVVERKPDEIGEIRARIAEARIMAPTDDQRKAAHRRIMHCRDCWNQGRDAAVAKIAGETE